MKRVLYSLLAIVICAGLIVVVVQNWSFLFAKTVTGEVLEVERVIEPTYIGSGGVPSNQVFSFAVAIKAEDGEIFTSSSEDRQWAVARKGGCVEAKFYPYPPWEFGKANTYLNARLVRLLECAPSQDVPPPPAPE